jgi:hypothetical protein
MADTSPPSLTFIGLPSDLDMNGQDQTVDFSVKAIDPESGVNFVRMKLDKPISQVAPDGRVF